MRRCCSHYFIYMLMGIELVFGIFAVNLSAQQQELVLTIEPILSSDKLLHFAKAETLRTQMKFQEAIAAYQQVLAPGEFCGKEAEAHYDIGICYTWLGKKNTAEEVFQQVLKTYPEHKEVLAHSQFCLSWIDVQRGQFQQAIERLQKLLDQKIYADKEFCAKVQFEIGRIYLVFLQDPEKAELIFHQVLAAYPDAAIKNHPFLEKLKRN